jgi:hypothetical protein
MIMHFTNPNFFILAYKPCTLEALIDNIWLKITNTGNNVLWQKVDKMQCHVQVCLADGGGHFQHWRKVIQFTMNSCMCHLNFISFCAHIIRLQTSVPDTFYMNNPVQPFNFMWFVHGCENHSHSNGRKKTGCSYEQNILTGERRINGTKKKDEFHTVHSSSDITRSDERKDEMCEVCGIQ